MRWILLGCALATCATAQLQISLFDGKTETALAPVTNLGATAMGDSTEYRFHARNLTAAAIALQPPLQVAGSGFTLSSQPQLPYIVAPGNFVEFRIRFAPYDAGTYSARLTVNGISNLLSATAKAAPVLSLISDGPASVLAAGAPIDFGRIQKKTSAARTVRMANATAAALTIANVALSGAVFHGATGLKLPLQLAPAAAVEFAVTFDPQSAGQYTGTLTVDDRSLVLTGIAFDPPLPPATVSVTGAQASGAQAKVAVTFASKPESSGNGTLTLDFRPAVAGVADDPSILFPAGSSRKLSFTVAEGDPVASFNGLKEVALQTGTTAGVITLTLNVAGAVSQTQVAIPAAAVSIDKASALRRVSDLDVTITAFDNTRTAGQFTFTFYDTAGRVVAPGAIKVDATADFGRYFAISRVGGSFLTRVTFPVTGDATQIAGVEVSVANQAGASQTGRLSF